MSYRRLPERKHARAQFDLVQDKRLRALERRARYPGAMRVVEADTVDVTTGTQGVYLSTHVESGSWGINAGCNISWIANNATESAIVGTRVYDEIVGGELPAIGPYARWVMRGVAGAGVTQPFMVFGHGHFENPVRIDLYIVIGTSGSAHAVTIEELCIQACPF